MSVRLDLRDSLADTRTLLAFRVGLIRGRSRRYAALALGVLLLITVLSAVVPAYLPESRLPRNDVRLLIPAFYAGFALLNAVASAATGGGRELLSPQEALPHPISPTTDFFGGLTIAPLNIAWLLQAWSILASVAYSFPVGARLPGVQLLTALMLAIATLIGVVIGWGLEWLRRTTGTWAVRAIGIAALGLGAWTVLGHHEAAVIARLTPLRWIEIVQASFALGDWGPWLIAVPVLITLGLALVAAGALLARQSADKMRPDEVHLETAFVKPRGNPGSDFVGLLRLDRAGAWRTVSLRRGILLLGVLPGIAALTGVMPWNQVALMPGLICSGGALLYGVNMWCLDAGGAIWRESLPIAPNLALWVRASALVELFASSTLPALIGATVRNGLPTISEGAAAISATVAAIAYVTTRCMRWSLLHPYAADLRSARATPAPPLAMVGYSVRLAVPTTIIGMVFGAASALSPLWSVLAAAAVVGASILSVVRSARRWSNPLQRASVLAIVAS